MRQYSLGRRNGKSKGTRKKLLLGLVCLALLTPLGLLLPKLMNCTGAWGEWDPESLHKMMGFLPEGLKKTTGLWKPPLPDYTVPVLGTLGSEASGYAVSGFIGILIVVLVTVACARIFGKHDK